jgi:N-acyl-phosphatidylethanolamine-hydrolysing phospholipase D
MVKLNMPSKKFTNPHAPSVKRNLIHFLKWRLGWYADPYKQNFHVPSNFSYPNQEGFDKTKPTSVWIGHSTFLIEAHGLGIITDPIWSDSPVTFLGPKRKQPPGVTLEKIPPLDIGLISHNHHDHMDLRSISRIAKKNPHMLWILPPRVERWFQKNKLFYKTLGWKDRHLFEKSGQKCAITAVPAQHFSGRYFFDLNRSGWNGYILHFQSNESNKKLYFVGDTGYNPYDFEEIGNEGPFDLALIPIGSYMPENFMKAVHISPQEAVQIHIETKSKKSIAMHHSTFCLSDEPMHYPAYALYLEMQKKELPFETFRVVRPGQYVNW